MIHFVSSRTLVLSLCIFGSIIRILDARIVSTSYGKLKGVEIESEDRNTKYIFKNVPFASPPIGKLRYELPQPPEPWEGVRDATNYSAACPYFLKPGGMRHIMNEDCLYVNIFTSEKCMNLSCPVIIYYHGGGFSMNSAIGFNETFILERYVEEDVIFVTTSFRLGVLGVFYLADENAIHQNLAVHDGLRSLNFIHDQISNFGGNPDDINLMGHSSGGTLVLLFGTSPLIDPDQKLFKKIIVFSTAHLLNTPELVLKNCYSVAKSLGCLSSQNDTTFAKRNIIECMKGKSTSEILEAQRLLESNKEFVRMITPGPPFMKSGEPYKHYINNVVPRKIMIGTTIDENGYHINTIDKPGLAGGFLDFENPFEVDKYFRNYQEETNGTILETLAQAIVVSTALYSAAIKNAGGEVFLFQTNQEPGSTHVSDVQYFIGLHLETIHTQDMKVIDSFYSKMIVNFTKFGEPSPNWKPLDPSKMNYYVVEVDTERGVWPRMEQNYREDEVNFWLINMSSYDREFTKMKLKLSEATQVVPVVLMLEEYPLLDLINQWYFYAFLVLVAITLGFLIYFWPKKNEYTIIP